MVYLLQGLVGLHQNSFALSHSKKWKSSLSDISILISDVFPVSHEPEYWIQSPLHQDATEQRPCIGLDYDVSTFFGGT